ncbi:DUF4382 domain-containing protein [Candidatus Bathyarchaeota archaeon]|nr:MAG: DUF4382 domain-containing protein [Candidatus Bathyarchaeota archaeon]
MDLATRKMVYYGLVGLLIAGSTIALFQASPVQFLPKDGTLSIYLADIQPDIQGNQVISFGPLLSPISQTPQGLLSLNVTIDSVTIHSNGDLNDAGMTTNTKFTFDVMKPFDVSPLISNAKVPVENVTMVSLHVGSATAAVKGLAGLQPVKVPSEELKIPVSPAVHVKAQMTSSIVISGTAHIVFQGNGSIILTPVLHVEKTTEPQ